MPASRSDRQVLLFATGLIVVAGLFFASVLLVASGGGEGTPKPQPFYLGPKKTLVDTIRGKSPLYFANPFAGRGFWLDLVRVSHGASGPQLVAYQITVPGTKDCNVKWKQQRKAYVDCHGDSVPAAALDQYKLTFPESGARRGGVIIDLRKKIPGAESVTNTTVPAATTIPAAGG